MGKEILTFGKIEIEKKNYRQKASTFLRDVNIEKVLVSKKFLLVKKNYKYFIGYMYNNHKVKSLEIKQEAAFSSLIINKHYTTNSMKPF